MTQRPAVDDAAAPLVRATCSADELGRGRVVVDGVVLVRTPRGLRAFAEQCPHGAASLARASVDGRTVTCPRHGARFLLTTGRALSGPTRCSLATFAVREQDGVVQVLEQLHVGGLWERVRAWLRAGQ